MEITEVTVATIPTESEDVEVPTPPIVTQPNPGPLAPDGWPMEVPLYAKLRRRLGLCVIGNSGKGISTIVPH